MQTIGDKLRKKRVERKLKQEELADYLNISQRAYSKLENDESPIRIDILNKIAEFYKVSISEFLPESPQYSFERAENCQIGGGNYNNNRDEKAMQLYDAIINRQQEEINYLKGLLAVFKP